MSIAAGRWAVHDYPHNELTGKIIGAAIEVHRVLGPGYIESIYENVLVQELRKIGLKVRQQVPVEVLYDGVKVGEHELTCLLRKPLCWS